MLKKVKEPLLNFLYYNTGNFVYLGVQWLITILLIYMGGYNSVGVFSLAMTYGNIFGIIACYGLHTYQVSDLNGTFQDGEYVFSRIITATAALLSGVVYLIVTGYKEHFVVIVVYIIYKILESYSDVLSAIWQKNNKMHWVGISYSAKGILSLIFFVVTYLATKSLVYAVLAMTIIQLALLVGFDISLSKRFLNLKDVFEKSRKSHVFKLLKHGFLTMSVTACSTIFVGIPKIIIEKKLNSSLLGIFSTISAPTVVISLFAVGMLVPLTPKIADHLEKKDKKAFFRVFYICILAFVFVGLLAIILSFFFGKSVFALLFGKEVIPYFYTFYMLIISSVLIAFVSCFATYYIVLRKLKWLMFFSVFGCVCVFVTSLIFIDKMGIAGGCVSMITALLLQIIPESVTMFIHAKKRFQIIDEQ